MGQIVFAVATNAVADYTTPLYQEQPALIKIVNRVRNHHFALGKDVPRYWELRVDPGACEVHRRSAKDERLAGLVLIPKSPAPAFLWQLQTCKPDAWYRVEATVRCELVPTSPGGGFVLVAVADETTESEGFELTSPPVVDAATPVSVRTYFHAPEGCREIRLGVGVRDAVGMAEIDEVRFIRILEPDELSHPHALQAPFAPGPPPVQSVCVCSDGPSDRPLATMLKLAMGEERVAGIPLGKLDESGGHEAILFPDATAPASIRTLKDLFGLSETRLVVISLPAFVALSRKAVRMRRVEQPDDPIHAKTVYACSATRGFALHDSFAYAWTGKSASSFVQNQFRDDEGFKAFCKKHGFKTLLVSNCDKDRTSDRPICLRRESKGGGLYVLDLNPIEAASSTMGEPTLAAHLLLSILRRSPSPAGQFTAPVRAEVQLRDMIREAPNRWDHFCVHDEDVPSSEVTHQIVTVGREDEMFGLPVAPKPVILIRSGLTSGDCESVYGVWAWIRQMLLHARHASSYARALSSRFRLAWVPTSTPWETRDGWSASRAGPPITTEIEMDDSPLVALIDVVSADCECARVMFAQRSRTFQRTEKWLPIISSALSSHEFPAVVCGVGNGRGSRAPFSWQLVKNPLTVAAEPSLFDEELHREALAKGADVIRIELPWHESDVVAQSIHQTHLSVTLLEQVVGLLYGVIAANRTNASISLDGLPSVEPGQSLIIDEGSLR